MAVSVRLGSGRAPQQLRKGPASHRAAAARRRTATEIVSKRDMILEERLGYRRFRKWISWRATWDTKASSDLCHGALCSPDPACFLHDSRWEVSKSSPPPLAFCSPLFKDRSWLFRRWEDHGQTGPKLCQRRMGGDGAKSGLEPTGWELCHFLGTPVQRSAASPTADSSYRGGCW